MEQQQRYNIIELCKPYLQKFTNFDNLTISNEIAKDSSVVEVLTDVTIVIPLNTLVDLAEEKAKLEQSLVKIASEIKRCEGMLNNPNFVNKAPQQKIEAERQKLKDYQQQYAETEKLLKGIK